MDRLLRFVLGRYIRKGSLTIITANGQSFVCGDGAGTPVAIRFQSAKAQRRLLFDPELALGELYMDGELTMERGSIADLLAIVLSQPEMSPRWATLQHWLRYILRHAHQFNPRQRSRNNVAHHYDLDARL